ncbi:MAG: hypothetical protein AAFO07_07445, partial [Bacteroidota bacterium]
VDGVGIGGNFVDITDESRQAIFEGSFDGTITYQPGEAPIKVNIFNPLDVVNGEFELRFVDEDMSNDQLDNNVRWELVSLSDPGQPVIASETTINRLNEQIIKEFGFSITVGQTQDVGESLLIDNNGAIGYEEEYANADPIAWLSGIPDDSPIGTTSFGDLVFNYAATSPGDEDAPLDPEQQLTNIGPGFFIPYYLANWRRREEQERSVEYITPAWTNLSGGQLVRTRMNLGDLNNVDIVFTPNKDLWSRCVIVETSNRYYSQSGFVTEGNRRHFDLRSKENVTKFDNDGNGFPDVDTDDPGTGMGWFPGYAVDVETGERLNIFFGENSTYNGSLAADGFVGPPTGGDMMFNPSSQQFLPTGNFVSLFNFIAGGQHFVYVTKTPYDECAFFRTRFASNLSDLFKVDAVKEITWAGLITANAGTQMLSYEDGLIPEELVVKLRVNNPFSVATGTGEFNGYPAYRFSIEGKQAEELSEVEQESALNMIKAVPNPYYGFSAYEQSQFSNIVKITNLPAKCTVTIYSLDGKFIRQYRRDEIGSIPDGVNRGLKRNQIIPDLEWDLNNSRGIPVASGVYLIHIDGGELGSRTLKWFGVNRQFDASGL